MNEDIKSVIEKIKKCLALANSTNENEAVIALRQAKKLMEIHGLSENEIIASELITKESLAKFSGMNCAMSWLPTLAFNISAFCGTSSYLKYIKSASGKTVKNVSVGWFGSENSIELSMYYFDYLSREINKRRISFIQDLQQSVYPQKYTKKYLTDSGNSYVFGLVVGVCDTLKKLNSKEQEQKTKDLAKIYADLNSKEFRDKKERYKPNHSLLAEHSRKGLSDSEDIAIRIGVKSNKIKQSLLS